MNKHLILLLAVCLVSVHAFVKRDAPEAAKDTNAALADELKQKLEDFAKDAGEKLKEAFDPDTLKKQFSDFVDTVQEGIEKVKPKTT